MANVDKSDESFARKDKFLPNRERHDQTWTSPELKKLRTMYAAGMSLEEMCCTLERPADGIISKLNQCHAILFDTGTLTYTHNPRFNADEPMQQKMGANAAYMNVHEMLCSGDVQQPIPTTHKEPIVAHKNIETKTFIRGRDAKDMSDGEVFAEIASLESEIARLGAIKAKSQKLAAQIEALQADINALVAYVDAR